MARKKVVGKEKSKDVASERDNRGNRMKGNIAGKEDGKYSTGNKKVLRSRSATKGEANSDEKAKGKEPMVEGNLTRGGENADEKVQGKKPMVGRNLMIYDEVALKDDGIERGKKVSGDRDWILKPHNPRQGNKKISEKAKGKKKLVVEEENEEEPLIPAKRRKPDNGIADPNMPSAERGAYYLRARKSVPSFQRLGLSESSFALVVGKRVKVYKSGSRKWVTGEVKSYNEKKKLHKVLYVDGESEELDLKSQLFEVEVMPGEASTLCTKNETIENLKSQKTKKTNSDVRLDDRTVEKEQSSDKSSDGDMVISEITDVSQKKKVAKTREKLATNAGKENTGDGDSASKSKPSQKTKKDHEGEVNVEKTKNPPRKGRSNSNTKK